MRTGWRLLVMVIALLFAVVPGASHAQDRPVLVTIAGNIEQANRGGRDDFDDAFLKFRDKTFDKALALDGSVLAKLKQVSISADAENWPKALALSGPRLKDVLALAGVSGRAISVMALDGYEIELTPAMIDQHDWVLASHADGMPLGIGGRGPLWLIHDTAGGKATDDEESRWVWSLFFIEVK